MMYLVLSPFDNEQSDLVHRVDQDLVLDELPLYRYTSVCLSVCFRLGQVSPHESHTFTVNHALALSHAFLFFVCYTFLHECFVFNQHS